MTPLVITWAITATAAVVTEFTRALTRLAGWHGDDERARALQAVSSGPVGYALITMLPAIGFPPFTFMRLAARRT